MQKFENTDLMAFVDGELDRESAAAVEAHLEMDADARAYVAQLRETDGALRSAILPFGQTPVPDRLVEAIQSGDARVRNGRRFGRRGWARAAAALAAGLGVAIVSGGGGYFAATYQFAALQTERALHQQAAERIRHDALQTALTTLISGKSLVWPSEDAANGRIVPIRTYKNKSGQYCREYRDEIISDDGRSIRYGVACRHQDKVWRNNYVLIPAKQPGIKNKQTRVF